jgi:uncharacterized repeat protein (TIGR03803 family)
MNSCSAFRLAVLASISLLAMLATPLSVCCQTFQELYAFTGRADGGCPHGPLIQARDGNFYGTTFNGGSQGYGTVFKMTPDGNLTTIVSFDWNNGQHPVGTLVEAPDGNLYGTTIDPLVFKVTPTGVLTAMVWPGGSSADDILLSTNGYIYGVTFDGGQQREGAIYRVLPGQSETFQQLFTFDSDHPSSYGYYPSSGLIQARDGNFYGVTDEGGTNSYGTVFRMTSLGTITTLGSFEPGPGARFPYGRLLQASDGNFYGAATGGSQGRIFKFGTNGNLGTFGWFDGANGEQPNGGLVEAPDGNFYGTATYFGTNTLCDCGTIFRLTPAGILTALVSFSGQTGPFPGATPYAGLTLGADGNLYGTTGTRGSLGNGNVFRIVMPGPLLTSRRAGEQLTLSWRTNYSGFTLQSSASLDFPNWVDLTTPPTISGGQFFVTNSMNGNAQFFRLKK